METSTKKICKSFWSKPFALHNANSIRSQKNRRKRTEEDLWSFLYFFYIGVNASKRFIFTISLPNLQGGQKERSHGALGFFKM